MGGFLYLHFMKIKEDYFPLVLFDGVCNLCENSIQFILAHEVKAQFTFASLQSNLAQQLLLKHQIRPSLDSLVLFTSSTEFYRESSAAWRIAETLKSPYSYLSFIRYFPLFIRDFSYRLIAKNRYYFWGKKSHCLLLHPDLKNRFI